MKRDVLFSKNESLRESSYYPLLDEMPCLHDTECSPHTKKPPHFSICFTLDVSIDVDHKAKLDSALYLLVDGSCVFIRGRELFQGVFFVV